MLAHLLEQEGLEVTWDRPRRHAAWGTWRRATSSRMAVAGSLLAIKAAVAKFRKHAPRREVEIDDDEDE